MVRGRGAGADLLRHALQVLQEPRELAQRPLAAGPRAAGVEPAEGHGLEEGAQAREGRASPRAATRGCRTSPVASSARWIRWLRSAPDDAFPGAPSRSFARCSVA